MNYEELLELLDIEEPEEFQYFEHFADLMECERPISYDALFRLMSGVDKQALSDVIENYFDEIAESLPDEGTEAFSFLKSMSMSLRGMLKPLISGEEGEGSRELVAFVEELDQFREWYVIGSNISCISKADGSVKETTFFEALLMSRLEKLEGEEYAYGFDEGLDYQLDSYAVSFADMMAAEGEEEEGFIEEDLAAAPEAEYRSGLSEGEYEF